MWLVSSTQALDLIAGMQAGSALARTIGQARALRTSPRTRVCTPRAATRPCRLCSRRLTRRSDRSCRRSTLTFLPSPLRPAVGIVEAGLWAAWGLRRSSRSAEARCRTTTTRLSVVSIRESRDAVQTARDERLPPCAGVLSRASNSRNDGSSPSTAAIYIDDETGRKVAESWWPGDPLVI